MQQSWLARAGRAVVAVGVIVGVVAGVAVGFVAAAANRAVPAGAQAEPAVGAIQGDVVVDVDGDGGITGADRRLAGVEIVVEGLADDGTEVVRETATDEVGRFEVVDLAPGVYTVREVQPSGWAAGTAVAGTSGAVEAHDTIVDVRVDSGASTTGIVFFEGAAVLRGSVVSDLGSATWSIPGATVTVSPVRPGSTAVVGGEGTAPSMAMEPVRVTTADDGTFTVNGLPLGTYELVADPAALGSSSGVGATVVEVTGDAVDAVDAQLEVELTAVAVPVVPGDGERTVEVLDPAGRSVAELDVDAATTHLDLPMGGWTLRVSEGPDTAVVRELDVLVASWRDVQPLVALDGSDPADVGADDPAPSGGGRPVPLLAVLAGAVTALLVAAIVALVVRLRRRPAGAVSAPR